MIKNKGFFPCTSLPIFYHKYNKQSSECHGTAINSIIQLYIYQFYSFPFKLVSLFSFHLEKGEQKKICSVFLEQYLVAYPVLTVSVFQNLLTFYATIKNLQLQFQQKNYNEKLSFKLCFTVLPSNIISWSVTLLESLKISLSASMVTCILSMMLNRRGSGINFCPQYQEECVS